MDKNVEAFVVHVTSINLSKPKIWIHPAREAQMAFLIVEEVKILTKYSDFADFFSEEKALVLSKQINLNKHIIKLEDGKQPPYELIYSLGSIELETLRTYIKTHLKPGFI